MDSSPLTIVAVPPIPNKSLARVNKLLSIFYTIVRDLSFFVAVPYLMWRLHLYPLIAAPFIIVAVVFFTFYISARNEQRRIAKFKERLQSSVSAGEMADGLDVVVVNTTNGQIVRRLTGAEFKEATANSRKSAPKISELSDEDTKRAEALRNAAII